MAPRVPPEHLGGTSDADGSVIRWTVSRVRLPVARSVRCRCRATCLTWGNARDVHVTACATRVSGRP